MHDALTELFGVHNMVDEQQILNWIEKTQLEDMGTVLTALADKVYAHRLENKGFVPFAVFEQLLGPVTVSVQIVHEVVDTSGARLGFALRKREENEAGEAYENQSHSTCTSFRWIDDIESALDRDDSDAFAGASNHPIEYLGMTYHHEAPRRNMDMTFMHRRSIRLGDVDSMDGNWMVFSDNNIISGDDRIIESNLHQLRWVMDANRKQFGVLTDSFPPQLR